MDNKQIHQNLLDKLQEQHVFWSFDQTNMDEITEDAFIGYVLLS